jgi:flagellar hook-length control protein FliK
VHLHFELQQLGPLDVEVNMAMPRVSATFWSETQSTLAALQPALQPLQQSLRSQGVEVDVLSARYGRLPERQHNQIQTSLVDLNV